MHSGSAIITPHKRAGHQLLTSVHDAAARGNDPQHSTKASLTLCYFDFKRLAFGFVKVWVAQRLLGRYALSRI